jgi:hypothetical protein
MAVVVVYLDAPVHEVSGQLGALVDGSSTTTDARSTASGFFVN